MMRISLRISWIPVIALALVFSVTGVRLNLAAGEEAKDSLAKEQRYGKYGGPFTLVDHHRKTVTDADFQGRYLLVFFGYTFCPDVCPTAMQTVSSTMDMLGEVGKAVQPLFVSVDPERDTPAVLADFVSNFHPRIVGLTGTKKQITGLANDYGVKFFKVYSPPSFDDTPDENEASNYSISHSAATYLIGPDGKFIKLFAYETPPEKMAIQIRKILE